DLVTAEDLEKFGIFGLTSPDLSARQISGSILIAALFALALTAYLYLYEGSLWRKPRQLLVLGLLIICAVLMAKVLVPTKLGTWDTLPLALFAILIAGLFEAELAIVCAILLSLVTGIMKDNSFAIAAI